MVFLSGIQTPFLIALQSRIWQADMPVTSGTYLVVRV
jgi:hypothetical protein